MGTSTRPARPVSIWCWSKNVCPRHRRPRLPNGRAAPGIGEQDPWRLMVPNRGVQTLPATCGGHHHPKSGAQVRWLGNQATSSLAGPEGPVLLHDHFHFGRRGANGLGRRDGLGRSQRPRLMIDSTAARGRFTANPGVQERQCLGLCGVCHALPSPTTLSRIAAKDGRRAKARIKHMTDRMPPKYTQSARQIHGWVQSIPTPRRRPPRCTPSRS